MLRIEKLFLQGFKSFNDPTELIFDEEGITAVVGPNGCGKCVSGDTLVTLADGRDVPIRDLVEAALDGSATTEKFDDGILTRLNPQSIEILSLNPTTLRLEARPVAAFVKRTATPHLLRVRTRSGREITATPYHPLFTLEAGSLRALKAEELKPGIRLAIPRRLPLQGAEVKLEPFDVLRQFHHEDEIYIPHSTALRVWADGARVQFGTWVDWTRAAQVTQTQLKGLLDGQAINAATLSRLATVTQTTPPLDGRLKSHGSGQMQLPVRFTAELARFCGLLVAEGRNTNANQVWFVNADRAVNDEFERLAASLFGLKVHREHYKPVAEDNLIYSRTLGIALERLFNFPVNSNSFEKEIPPQLFRAEAEMQWAFLSGLFEGDAYICANPATAEKKAHAYIEYVTASEKLARQVVALLLRRGVFALLRPKVKYASNTEAKRRRTYYSVLIYGTEQLRHVAQHLSFIGEKRLALQTLCELESSSNPNQDLIPGITPLIKEAVVKTGVKIKANRRRLVKLSAYVEQRCEASRGGLLEVIGQIEQFGVQPESARGQLEALRTIATSDVYWDEIVGIEQVAPPDEWVYDLSIAETHNFVAGNMIVHNSNVADAISWVIGEQRAKALRGSKMEDVIFQGSRSRQPAGMAEVALTMVVHETFEIRGEVAAAEAEKQAAEAAEMAAQAAEQAEAYQAEMNAEASDETAETDAASAEEQSQESAEQAGQPAQAKKRRRVAATIGKVFHEGERITVARRLYRSGESEYEMNGRSCRLRDIQDLFAGTGLGGAHYAIIEQGRIGQVLSAKPTDRRALIEEAAGISKFKMRQHSAELKLEASKQNLSRVTDILAEIERQQNSLRRQAGRARRYQKFKHEMRGLMRAVYVVDYRANTKTMTELESGLESGTAREAEITTLLAQLEEEQAVAAASSRSAEDKLNETRQLAADVNVEVERARQQHNYLTQQLQSLGSRAAQFAKDQAVIAERGQFIGQETARLREELQRIEQEINAESKALTDAENDHRTQGERDKESERKLEEARKRVYDSGTHLERWRQLKRQFTDSVDRCDSRLRGLANERERAMAQSENARTQHAELSFTVEEQTERQHQIGEELANTTSELSLARRLREEKQTKLNALHRELTATEQRLKSLTQLDERHSYFSEAVQALFGRPSANFKTLGTLADFVRVSPENESLVESALRDELQFVVVPSFDDALRAIDFLKTEGAGRATFLVVQSDVPQFGNGNHGSQTAEALTGTNGHNHTQSRYQTLGSLLGLKPEFAEAFKFALPSLDNARIVSDAGEAVQAAIAQNGDAHKAMMLARTGERVIGGRLITGGGGEGNGMGVLALKREIGELTDKLDALTEQEEMLEAELSEVKARIARLEEDQKRLDAEQRQIEKQLAVQREKLQQLSREMERTATHIRVVEQETAQAEEERADFETKLQHAAAQTKEAEVLRAEAEQIVQAAQAELADLRRASEQRVQELSRRRAEFATKTERRRGLSNDIRRLENESGDLTNRLERSRFEAIEAEEQSSTMQTTLVGTTEQLQTLVAQQQLRAAELEEKSFALAAARERLETLDAQLRNERDALMRARDQRTKKEIERAKLTSDLEHLLQACHAELGENIVEVCERLEQSKQAAEAVAAEAESSAETNSDTQSESATPDTKTDDTNSPLLTSAQPTPVPLSAAGLSTDDEDREDEIAVTEDFEISFWQVPEDFNLESAKVRLDELRAKIDALGPVNMMAIQEVTEIEERFDFLSTQKVDIEKAIADTQAAIAEIKKRSRERFVEAFHAINANFKTMFVELFGGGQGEMRLIDETDVLESGIEIIAQPPGKRLQNVLLLSGGEKAMTAMALVLGIFKYRPSPFCLLDEVDAPLDEMNVGRFSDKVLEMSQNTQFMVITHSKRTMEAAKTLYGVTMEDPGVSKLISVKLS